MKRKYIIPFLMALLVVEILLLLFFILWTLMAFLSGHIIPTSIQNIFLIRILIIVSLIILTSIIVYKNSKRRFKNKII
jgi:hypothetical protein